MSSMAILYWGTLSGGPAFVGEGPIFSVPHAVLNNGTVEVFTLN